MPKRLPKGLILGFCSFVLTAGVMITGFTSITYARSCAKLTGYAGFLQHIGLVAAGPCPSKPGGTICSGGLACTASSLKAGTCKNVAAVGQPANCQCIENTMTKGLSH